MKTIYDVIISPVMTEAAYDRFENKTYTFKVRSDATKPEIAAAVEQLFKVEVKDVNTIKMKRKPKRLGVHSGYTSAWKKAIVKLTAESKTIEFFDSLM